MTWDGILSVRQVGIKSIDELLGIVYTSGALGGRSLASDFANRELRCAAIDVAIPGRSGRCVLPETLDAFQTIAPSLEAPLLEIVRVRRQ